AAALISSGGRAAVLGAAVAIGLYFIITRRPWRVMAACIVGVLIALVVPSVGSNPQLQRLSEVNRQVFSSDSRLFIYSHSLRAFADDPLVGTGLGVRISIASPEPGL